MRAVLSPVWQGIDDLAALRIFPSSTSGAFDGRAAEVDADGDGRGHGELLIADRRLLIGEAAAWIFYGKFRFR